LRVYPWRGAYAAGAGMRFVVAAAITKRWHSLIKRAPSALSNGER